LSRKLNIKQRIFYLSGYKSKYLKDRSFLQGTESNVFVHVTFYGPEFLGIQKYPSFSSCTDASEIHTPTHWHISLSLQIL
jgi:hypothetical protein